MNTLTILVGNIGSGKTTWIRENRKPEELVVSRDDLRYMFGGGEYLFDPHGTESVIKSLGIQITKLLCIEGRDIIVDETNVSRGLRENYIKIAKGYGYKVIVVELPRYSKRKSVNRRMRDPHGQFSRAVWNGVWEMFDNMYEIPRKSEGIDKITKVKK